MQAAPYSKAVRVLPLSNPVRLSPVERFDFEAAITRAFLTGLAYQRKLQRAEVRA